MLGGYHSGAGRIGRVELLFLRRDGIGSACEIYVCGGAAVFAW